jgi:DNA-binding XRE family transcriptional regulator
MQVARVYTLDTMTGRQLRQARSHLGMTQKELGEALGVHWNSVARMERDEFPIIRTTELAVKYLLVMESKKRGKKNERVR